MKPQIVVFSNTLCLTRIGEKPSERIEGFLITSKNMQLLTHSPFPTLWIAKQNSIEGEIGSVSIRCFGWSCSPPPPPLPRIQILLG